jgi:DNA-binding CsgD family transcriptional regulator
LEDGPLRNRLAQEAEHITMVSDSIYLISMSDGFGRLNLSRFKEGIASFQLPRPRIHNLQNTNAYLPLDAEEIKLTYKDSRHLSFEVATNKLLTARYHYVLQGPADLEASSEDGVLQFQNLPYGDYNLEVATISADGTRSEPASLAFTIGPPWYLSRGIQFIYFLLLVLTVLAIRWYNRAKLYKKQRLIKLEMQQEHERSIAQLEKEKMAREIREKQNELASTALNIAKKNELMLDIKSLLLINKDKFDNQQRYRAFMKKLNSSINDTQDWKSFEVNFNALHEDFFENLLGKYPDLTPKDLKLCAYLKMNLSSKEIAPLMGITTRGVEIHRYRLRKKLDLDSNQNITNFLITMK